MAVLDSIDIRAFLGLRPTAWLCVGAGYSREDIKAELLKHEEGIVGEAVTSLEEIAVRIISRATKPILKESVLSGTARQEILKALISNASVARSANGFPELKKLRRQSGFFRKLDFAVQAGRLAFAHEAEEQVYLERLEQRLGENTKRPVQDEIRVLAAGFEAWLRGSGLWDAPLLFSEASRILSEQGWPEGLSQPQRLYIFSNQTVESREREFRDALQRHLEVIESDDVEPLTLTENRVHVERWHSWDDAAEGLCDAILGELEDFSEHVILISDHVHVRRSLNRVLRERKLPQADPRDPTRIRWDETLKWAMLPLEVVGRDFERSKVVAWVRTHSGLSSPETLIAEIHSRGARQGLSAYTGGNLTLLEKELKALQFALGGKKSCVEIREAHLGVLKAAVRKHPEDIWILGFFERLWKELERDLTVIGSAERPAPLRIWLEKVQTRLQETPSPVEQLKAAEGIAIYRLQTAPTSLPKKVWILGLPPDWFSGDAAGDYWFSEREREILGAEFSVRSGLQIRRERISAFAKWTSRAENVRIFDAAFEPDGRERETLSTLFRELGLTASAIESIEKGAHPRWRASYGAQRPLQPQEIVLAPLSTGAKPEVSATALDYYSRCSFQALAYHRWKARDLRDPDTELWPEVRGNILHQAVKHLLESRDGDGQFQISTREALERGWKEKPPRGLLKSARVESYVRARMLKVLDVFVEKERDYFARAKARVISLDDQRLALEYPEFNVIGTPDRIDETDDGLFLMDYKTSSALPNGTDMLELGYRLQLPFYALAARQKFQKPIAGVQFIELTGKGARGAGMFFKKYNGKETGKFTQVTARSKSLLTVEPEEAWSQMEEQIAAHAKAYLSGQFAAKPKKKEKECAQCQLGDLCGLKRKTADEIEEEDA